MLHRLGVCSCQRSFRCIQSYPPLSPNWFDSPTERAAIKRVKHVNSEHRFVLQSMKQSCSEHIHRRMLSIRPCYDASFCLLADSKTDWKFVLRLLAPGTALSSLRKFLVLLQHSWNRLSAFPHVAKRRRYTRILPIKHHKFGFPSRRDDASCTFTMDNCVGRLDACNQTK